MSQLRPTSELDVQVLLNDKLELKSKDFEKIFDVEENESEIVLMQKDYIKQPLWGDILAQVKEWGGKFAIQPRRFIIPKPQKVKPKIIPIDELMPPETNARAIIKDEEQKPKQANTKSYGKKCNIIFIRKVRRRLEELEEKYKGLAPQERAKKINEQLLNDFCVDKRQMQRWKRVVRTADKLKGDINVMPESIRPTTLYEIAKLPEQKQVEVAKKVVEKNLTVTETKKLVREALQKDQPPLPTEPFNVIYADPPWQYDVKLRGTPEDHYLTLTLEELKEKKPRTTDNAILFLWATNPMLQEALELMHTWGFKYKTNIVWVKNKITTGFYVRGQHELLLIGVKGDTHPPEQSNRKSSVLMAPVSKHSEKPKEVYQIIEEMYPSLSKIEMFAREKREGWHSWGNEV